MTTFAAKVIAFNASLSFTGDLPEGIRVMNPFRENNGAMAASTAFYRRFYNDTRRRFLILGINPGRLGGGLTGVPFTDPKRLLENCGIECFQGPSAHEPSSVFIYEMIRQYGGVESFYRDFYIHSICPLGFTALGKNGKEVNYNYYDRKELWLSARPFMVEMLRRQLSFGIHTDVCFCLGTGKNAACIASLNDEYGFFKRIVPLEHPRYIIQYKSKEMDRYLDKYLVALRTAVSRYAK